MDFGLLPPEVNSGRMYTGPGPAPMLAAAAAWDALAAELHNMAATYEAAISDLAAGWQGPSSETMAAAAAPYTAWLHATAAQAEQTAAQGRTAAAAYEAAFAATVPPPLIEANRSLLMTLIATNLLGQNTPAIAATEAHYAEMWAQDTTAMYGYAASSTLATQLSPFTEPPQTANPAGAVNQSAAAAQSGGAAATSSVQTQLGQLGALVSNTLQGLATSAPAAASSPIEDALASIATFMSNITGPYSPVGWIGIPGGWWLTAMQVLGTAQNVPGVLSLLNGPAPISGALGPLAGGYVSLETPIPGAAAAVGRGAILASLGGAPSVGALSVPTGWASAVPTVKALASALPSAGPGAASALASAGQSSMFGEMAMSSLAGRALAGSAAQSVVGTTARVIDRKSTVVDDDASAVTILVIQPTED